MRVSPSKRKSRDSWLRAQAQAGTANALVGFWTCSGVTFLSGAIGMEILGSMIVSSYESEAAAISSLAHVLSQAVEEALEMVGMGLFFCSLLDFIKLERISLWISTPPQVIGES